MSQEKVGQLVHSASQLGVVGQDGFVALGRPAACGVELPFEPANLLPRVGDFSFAVPQVAPQPPDAAGQEGGRQHEAGQEA